MFIGKKAILKDNYYQDMKFFSSAREALKSVLQVCYNQEYTLFLPGYIGFSPREGSGIYDPVCELGLKHVFYSFTENLTIDIDKLILQIEEAKGNKVFLLVHYFGYVDTNYNKLISVLKRNNFFIIEDAAHALYTHLVDGQCGQGNCIFYSFHKMLPFQNGGAICTADFKGDWWGHIVSKEKEYPFYKYNLKYIAEKRKENALYWEELLKDNQRLKILRPSQEYIGQTPQTFPILLNFANRYEVYLIMNQLNYGVISLYHTMVAPIQEINEPNINRISETILNLPVHQDIGRKEIIEMYNELIKHI